MENKQFEPSYLVVPDTTLEAAGRDQHLEKALEALADGGREKILSCRIAQRYNAGPR
jgi:hypothetical protein